jgi:cell wall-associated NlpC family hydrolase
MPRTGSTVLFSDWGKKKSWWIRRADLELGRENIQEGDIVFYFFAAKGRIAHTGIVVDANSNTDFKTVEGNTSSGLKDVVDRDGQGVYMKQRSISALGLFGGIVRLPY